MTDMMAVFNGEKMTRREIEIARDAFVRGGQFAFSKIRDGGLGIDYNRFGEWTGLIPESAERWPLPTITRPRVVPDPHIAGAAWRIVDGRVQYRDRAGGEWQSTERMGMCNGQPTAFSPTPQRIKIWADLLAQPTETVEE